MNKTYRVTRAYISNMKIEAFESGKNDYNVDGASAVLEAFGYRCTKREY